MDLYPLETEDLQLLGHLSSCGSIDLVDELNQSDRLTEIPPYGVDPKDLIRKQQWMEIVERNVYGATATTRTERSSSEYVKEDSACYSRDA
jgi:hypothetical protein